MTGKGMLRISARLADPFAQHVLMEIQIAGRLRLLPRLPWWY
jgi:hypothetical protein